MTRPCYISGGMLYLNLAVIETRRLIRIATSGKALCSAVAEGERGNGYWGGRAGEVGMSWSGGGVLGSEECCVIISISAVLLYCFTRSGKEEDGRGRGIKPTCWAMLSSTRVESADLAGFKGE